MPPKTATKSKKTGTTTKTTKRTKPQRKRGEVTSKVIELDMKKAKDIIGFREVGPKEQGISMKTPNGTRKFVMDNNKSNRPFGVRTAEDYGETMLKQQWAGQKNSDSSTCNGEPLIVDWSGQVVSAAHRCVGLLFAEYERLRLVEFGETEKLEELGCDGPITVPVLLVEGVDPIGADTNDTGRNRKLADIFYRRREFKEGKSIPESALVQLSRELAVAVRLVWLRTQGLRVARGPKLPNTEAIKFLEAHPLLHDAVEHVYHENGGNGADGKKISNFISLGYAAGMLYLMAYIDSDVKKWHRGEYSEKKKPTGWTAAEEFWTTFAQEPWGTPKVEPIKALHTVLMNNRMSEDNFDRDALCCLCVRSFLSWTKREKKWGDSRKLRSKLFVKDADDKQVLDFERLQGIDLERETLEEMGLLAEEVEVERNSVGTWKVGDTAWVVETDEEGTELEQPAWFGEITAFSDDGSQASLKYLTDADDNKEDEGSEYNCAVSWLTTEKPEVEEEEEEE